VGVAILNAPPRPPQPPYVSFSIRWQSANMATVSWTQPNPQGEPAVVTAASALDFTSFPALLAFTTPTHRVSMMCFEQRPRVDGSNALPTTFVSLSPEATQHLAVFNSLYPSALAAASAPPGPLGLEAPGGAAALPNSTDRVFFRILQTPVDLDGDGILDPWEIQHGLNVFDAMDSAQDADGDGVSNQAENALGLDPNDPDADGDGVRDGLEVRLSRSPSTVAAATAQPVTRLSLHSPSPSAP
jgi:hypothetical protein